jgi:intraflagellar transport protein 80
MRLKITNGETPSHQSMVTAVGWCKTGKQYELLSCGDDQALWKWSVEGLPITKLGATASYPTAMAWMPNSKGSDNTFALGSADGTFRLVGETGREEKKVEAHAGAVIALKWSFDGSALATAGEDGSVKVWSRTGMLRSTLTQMPQPVYSVVWSPDCEHLLFACGAKIHLKSIQAGQKQVEWKAHDGIVISLDWSFVNNTILSAGEDCKYKIWDSYGRLLYTSTPLSHVVTSIAWSPTGKYFAVGSYNCIKLCDRAGWSYCRETPDVGSLFSISWCSDGTQFAGVAAAAPSYSPAS